MSIRHTTKVRGGAVVALATVLALTLVGCGDGDGSKPVESGKSSPVDPKANGSQAPTPTGNPSPVPTQVIATVNGEAGMTLAINSAVRDAGGFLTVSGQLKNTGSQAFTSTAAWRGNELKGSGVSVAGVTLVDKAGKKRYYVLRDTDGRCLCTTGLTIIDPGQTIPFFAQFPTPPQSTTEVDFNLPTFATATIKISG
ncbi:hypothetical protein NJL88_06625 [Streptomyces sp. DK15]|uniref:hypothetical protein n=1 Tax=Streptomyces sp. DK15 TaxID=2957499 RepID=UPI0029BD492C|nr:hypothetical protein [Streptomyces sp. DK15]MDX2389739.1 hypothetical protein [Streptomyces sp. DK15]